MDITNKHFSGMSIIIITAFISTGSIVLLMLRRNTTSLEEVEESLKPWSRMTREILILIKIPLEHATSGTIHMQMK